MATSTTSSISNQPLYEEIHVIGHGSYGTVYKGIDLKTSKIVAMKRIRIKVTEEGLPISTIREIAYLRHLEKYEHENIVRLFDVCHGPRLNNEQSIILIFEYVDYDLDRYLRRNQSNLNFAKIQDLTKQILIGVDFLHINRIIHRDLKPQNILITKDDKVKVADFGLARLYGFTMALTSVVVTLWYRAPEVLLQSNYATSVDLWSIGCIFAELYMRRPLFCGQSDIDQLYKIFQIMGVPNEHEWPTQSALPRQSFLIKNNITNNEHKLKDAVKIDDLGLDLLKLLLDFNIFTRITARDALLHDYFKQDSTGMTNQTLLPDITNNVAQQQQQQPNILKCKRNKQNQMEIDTSENNNLENSISPNNLTIKNETEMDEN